MAEIETALSLKRENCGLKWPEDCRIRELTLVRKNGQDLDTTRRSARHDRAFQMGNGKEMSGGSRLPVLSGRQGVFIQVGEEFIQIDMTGSQRRVGEYATEP